MLLSVQMRLGDMDLIIEVEEDFTSYGDECKFGGGKVRHLLIYLCYSVTFVKDNGIIVFILFC